MSLIMDHIGNLYDPCLDQASTVTLTYFSPQLLDLRVKSVCVVQVDIDDASDCQLY